MSRRVAVIGMGAVGHVIARAIEPRVELVRVDRWTSQLPTDAGSVDAIIVTTKTPGTEWAARVGARILAPTGVALTIQNGLGTAEILAKYLGGDRVARGVFYGGVQLFDDGSLEATAECEIEIGRPLSPSAAGLLEHLAAVLRAGGIAVQVYDDVTVAVWRKLVVNCSVNPVTALLGCTHEQLLQHPTAPRLVDALAIETARIAAAVGVNLSAEFATQHWRAVVTRFSSNPRSSMLQDVLMGRETEIEALSGSVSAVADRGGVPSPLNRAVTELIRVLHPQSPATRYSFSPRMIVGV